MLSNNLLWNLNSTLSAMEKIQKQLASTLAATKPSDNPVAVTKALRITNNITANTQYEKNAKDAMEWMNATDTALQDIEDQLDKVRELMIEAANDTNTNASGRPEIAVQVREILTSVVDAINTNIGGQYIFGGTNTTEPPCTMYGALDPLTWRDNSSQNFYEVGMGITIGVNTTAQEVFKQTGLVECLQLVYSHLQETEAKGSTILGGRNLMTTDAAGNYTADLNFMTKGLDIQGMRFLAADPASNLAVQFVQGSVPSVTWNSMLIPPTDGTIVVTYAEHDTARDIMAMWDNIATDEVKSRVSVSLIENVPGAIQSQPPIEPNTPLEALTEEGPELLAVSQPMTGSLNLPTFCGMLDLTVNGVRKQIYMDGNFTGDPAGMMNHLQAKLDEAYGTNALKVTIDGQGQIEIQDMQTQGYESLILIHGGQVARQLFAPTSVHGLVDVRNGADFGVAGKTLSIVVNGERQDIRLTGNYTTGNALAAYVEGQINAAFGFDAGNDKADLAVTVRVNQWGYLEIVNSPNAPYTLFNADNEISPSLNIVEGDAAVALFGKNWEGGDVVTNGYSLTRGADALYLSHRDELGGSDLEWLDRCITQVLKCVTEAGAKVNRLEGAVSRLTAQRNNYEIQLKDAIGAEQIRLSVDLSSLENIYNASLSVGARIILPTLMDFLS
jgi:flagellar hook-associated protein 3 FlgL